MNLTNLLLKPMGTDKEFLSANHWYAWYDDYNAKMFNKQINDFGYILYLGESKNAKRSGYEDNIFKYYLLHVKKKEWVCISEDINEIISFFDEKPTS